MVEEEILERNIKIRAQEIINNKKLSQNFKNLKSGCKITSADLNP